MSKSQFFQVALSGAVVGMCATVILFNAATHGPLIGIAMGIGGMLLGCAALATVYKRTN